MILSYIFVFINENKAYNIYLFLNDSFNLDCGNSCFNEKTHKLLIENNICVNDCLNNLEYNYDCNNICYKLFFENNENLFDEECPDNRPFKNEHNNCIEECDVISLFMGLSKIKTINYEIINIIALDIKKHNLNN